MRIYNIAFLIPAFARGQCPLDLIEIPLENLTGLRFVGFNPTVSRFSGPGMVSLNLWIYLCSLRRYIVLAIFSVNMYHRGTRSFSKITQSSQ